MNDAQNLTERPEDTVRRFAGRLAKLQEGMKILKVDLSGLSEDQIPDKALALIDELGRLTDWMHQHKLHPDFEYVVTSGPRKAWDDVDNPPEGEGWELNITKADPEAFERFRFHEERYWRRRNGDWCPFHPNGKHSNTESLNPASYSKCKCGAKSAFNPDRFA